MKRWGVESLGKSAYSGRLRRREEAAAALLEILAEAFIADKTGPPSWGRQLKVDSSVMNKLQPLGWPPLIVTVYGAYIPGCPRHVFLFRLLAMFIRRFEDECA